MTTDLFFPHEFLPADVLDWVRYRTGLRRDGVRGECMARRIRQEMERASIRDEAGFIRHLEADPEVEAAFIDRITNGETYFFRDREQVELLSRAILPELARERGGNPLRLCSVGCATGEEAYTLAMLAEEAGLAGTSVFGLDLSPAAIAHARIGRYRRWSLRNLDPMRRWFFCQDGDAFTVVDRIRRQVRFDVLNLTAPTWPAMPSRFFDVVLCRNVLVYLVPEVVPVIARRLAACLAPGGWLMVAPTDPWLPCDEQLLLVRTGAGLAYRRPFRWAEP